MSKQLQKKVDAISRYIMAANITEDKGYLVLALRDTEELINELKEQLK